MYLLGRDSIDLGIGRSQAGKAQPRNFPVQGTYASSNLGFRVLPLLPLREGQLTTTADYELSLGTP
jgi:hypothetical protein